MSATDERLVGPRPAGNRPGSAPRTPLMARPLASYHLLLGCTSLLLALGLVMVFSASNVRSLATTGSLFSTGIKQGTFIAFGVPLMMVLSRMPVRFFRACAYPALLVSLGLLVLVLVLAEPINGARSWIPLPMGFNLQPAELAKLALVLWGADLLVRKQRLLGERKHLLVPLIPVSVLVLGLVMLQPDLGTSVALASIVAALLYVVGTPLRMFGALCGAVLAGVAAFAITTPHAMARLVSFRDPFQDPGGDGYQAVQGFYALSSGGVLGRGLGASKEKWSGGLPEAHTDYVFAIIGEELGLLGTLSVLVLFGLLLFAGIRIATRATDPFVRLCSFAVTAWLGCQAVINMGAVVGLLPITGIPLPLVSFGGSAMLVTLAAIGMLLAFARIEPGAAAELRTRPGVLGRLRGETGAVPRQRTLAQLRPVQSGQGRPRPAPSRRAAGRR